MSVIERLQKISAQLFSSALKTYTLKDCIIHKRVSNITLIDMISGYPNKGIGFFVRRKTWPQNMKILLTDAKFKSHRHARVKGIKYFDNEPFRDCPSHFNGSRKRSVWTYELGNVSQHQIDNGMIYNQADYQAYYAIRKIRPAIHKQDVEQYVEQNDEQQIQQQQNDQ